MSDNGRLLADNNLSIVHFGPAKLESPRDRPFTVAFRGQGDLVEVAVAVTHPKDRFIRKVGTEIAVEKFLAGKTVKIPVPRHFQRKYAFYISVLFGV